MNTLGWPFDADAARVYLLALFESQEGFVACAFRHLAPGMLSGQDRDCQDWWEDQYEWPAQLEELLEDCRVALACGAVDVYVCPMLRADRSRRKARAGLGRVAWIDLDRRIGDIPLPVEAWVVASGSEHHSHVYVPLVDAVSGPALEGANRALMRLYGGDRKWSNESLLRLPGTWNFKTDPPQPVRFEILPHGPGLLSAALLASLGPDPLPGRGSIGIDPPRGRADHPLDSVDALWLEAAARYERPLGAGMSRLLREGDVDGKYAKADGTPDRSRVLSTLAHAGVRAGWTLQRFLTEVLEPTNLGGAKVHDRVDGRDYATSTYANARARIATVNQGDFTPVDITELCAAILIDASARTWDYRTKNSDTAALEALLSLAHTHRRMPVSVSMRGLTELTGMGRKTAEKALRRLERHRYIQRVKIGRGTTGSEYLLLKPGTDDPIPPREPAGYPIPTLALLPWYGDFSAERPQHTAGLPHDLFFHRAHGKNFRAVLLALDDKPYETHEIAKRARVSPATALKNLRQAYENGLAAKDRRGWVRAWTVETLPEQLDLMAERGGHAGRLERTVRSNAAERKRYRERQQPGVNVEKREHGESHVVR